MRRSRSNVPRSYWFRSKRTQVPLRKANAPPSSASRAPVPSPEKTPTSRTAMPLATRTGASASGAPAIAPANQPRRLRAAMNRAGSSVRKPGRPLPDAAATIIRTCAHILDTGVLCHAPARHGRRYCRHHVELGIRRWRMARARRRISRLDTAARRHDRRRNRAGARPLRRCRRTHVSCGIQTFLLRPSPGRQQPALHAAAGMPAREGAEPLPPGGSRRPLSLISSIKYEELYWDSRSCTRNTT